MFGLQTWRFRLGGLNTTKPLKTVKVLLDAGGPQQASEAAADNLVFMSKYLNADEDEGENMLPKAQPGQMNLQWLLN